MFRGHTPLKIYDHCLRYLQSFSTQRSRQSLLFNSTLRTTIAPTVQDPKEDPTVQDPTVQGDRTTTRFKRQPAAPIHPHHSIANDSDQCRKRRNEAITTGGCVPSHKENLHGAYLAFTQGDAHENPTPEKIRKKIRQSKIRQTRANNPIQTTVGSTNTCSSFHSQG